MFRFRIGKDIKHGIQINALYRTMPRILKYLGSIREIAEDVDVLVMSPKLT